jgi:hypothetical protein
MEKGGDQQADAKSRPEKHHDETESLLFFVNGK